MEVEAARQVMTSGGGGLGRWAPSPPLTPHLDLITLATHTGGKMVQGHVFQSRSRSQHHSALPHNLSTSALGQKK